MQVTDKLKEQFGEKWIKYFRPFIESEQFDIIFKVLRARKGKIRTAPDSADVFRCFKECDPDNLKVIFVGISPYHTFTKEGTPIADGLMMGCSRINRLQPSLEQFYSDLENTYHDDIDVDMIQDPNLQYLSRQGVLLYNVSLTVQEGKACSDNDLWKEFDKFFWEEVINKYFRGLVCVFMGTQCHKSASYLLPMVHYSFLISHPASAAYNNTTWSSGGIWLQIDTILQQNSKARIQWYRRKGDDDEVPWDKPKQIDRTPTKSAKELGLPEEFDE